VRLTALDENIDDPGVKDEQEFRLKKLVYEDDVFEYEYDFGDCWEHEIEAEKILEPEAGVKYPRCLAGGRACPPEDCGGPGGYEELLKVLDDPGHEDYDHYHGWAGEDFDPERFDLAKVNRVLRRV